MLLVRTKDLSVRGTIASVDGLQSMSWWLARVLFIHQRVLDERSSSLFDLLHVFVAESLHHFGTLEKVSGYWGPKLGDEEKKVIVSMVHLEAGMVEHSYGRIDSCRSVSILFFSNLHFELSLTKFAVSITCLAYVVMLFK